MSNEMGHEHTMKTEKWGFDTEGMDTSFKPGVDFYQYAVGGWLKKNTVPEDESRWGSFLMVRKETDEELRKLVTERGAGTEYPTNSPEQRIFDRYDAAIDWNTRIALGLTPIAEDRARISAVHDRSELIPLITELHKKGVGVFGGAGVMPDIKNTAVNILYFGQGGLGMPERKYYLESTPEILRIRTAYMNYMKNMFVIAGDTPEDAHAKVEKIIALETRLAEASMDDISLRDPEKQYHKMAISELEAQIPGFDWRGYLLGIDAGSPETVIMEHPEFFKAMNTILTTTDLADIALYCDWHLLNASAGSLNEKMYTEAFDYTAAITGQKVMRPVWRRGLDSVNGSLGELLGQIYVKKYFTEEAKKKMDELVTDIFAAYEARIRALDWMSTATKERALAKLAVMRKKIGYPEKWKSYDGLTIVAGDHFGNSRRIAGFEHAREMKKLAEPVDREEWHMPPQTVNAYYSPIFNEVVFPAAILQWPFFDPTADDAVNYAAIGSTIGHEITHGFDDEGSKFDAQGNLIEWWTPEDRKSFEDRTKVVETQFDGYTVEDGIHLKGKLTLGENIADLGGVQIAFDAYQAKLKRTGRATIDGYTPEQRFFLAFAQQEREVSRPEMSKHLALNDHHSPPRYRVNGPLSHMQDFFDAFGIKKGDPMYREPSERAKIW